MFPFHVVPGSSASERITPIARTALERGAGRGGHEFSISDSDVVCSGLESRATSCSRPDHRPKAHDRVWQTSNVDGRREEETTKEIKKTYTHRTSARALETCTQSVDRGVDRPTHNRQSDRTLFIIQETQTQSQPFFSPVEHPSDADVGDANPVLVCHAFGDREQVLEQRPAPPLPDHVVVLGSGHERSGRARRSHEGEGKGP